MTVPPARVQRTRTRGGGMPPGSVYIGRRSKWGNPFSVAEYLDTWESATPEGAREMCVAYYRAWLAGDLDGGPGPEGTAWSASRRDWIRQHVADLAGRDLACWCPLPAPGEPDHCHGAVLLEIANATLTAVPPRVAADTTTHHGLTVHGRRPDGTRAVTEEAGQ